MRLITWLLAFSAQATLRRAQAVPRRTYNTFAACRDAEPARTYSDFLQSFAGTLAFNVDTEAVDACIDDPATCNVEQPYFEYFFLLWMFPQVAAAAPLTITASIIGLVWLFAVFVFCCGCCRSCYDDRDRQPVGKFRGCKYYSIVLFTTLWIVAMLFLVTVQGFFSSYYQRIRYCPDQVYTETLIPVFPSAPSLSGSFDFADITSALTDVFEELRDSYLIRSLTSLPLVMTNGIPVHVSIAVTAALSALVLFAFLLVVSVYRFKGKNEQPSSHRAKCYRQLFFCLSVLVGLLGSLALFAGGLVVSVPLFFDVILSVVSSRADDSVANLVKEAYERIESSLTDVSDVEAAKQHVAELVGAVAFARAEAVDRPMGLLNDYAVVAWTGFAFGSLSLFAYCVFFKQWHYWRDVSNVARERSMSLDESTSEYVFE